MHDRQEYNFNNRWNENNKWKDKDKRGLRDGYYAGDVSNGKLRALLGTQFETAHDLKIHYDVYSHHQHSRHCDVRFDQFEVLWRKTAILWLQGQILLKRIRNHKAILYEREFLSRSVTKTT